MNEAASPPFVSGLTFSPGEVVRRLTASSPPTGYIRVVQMTNMATLHRLILDDGDSIVACFADGGRHTGTRATNDDGIVTLVADDGVRTLPVEKLEAILPVESAFQIPASPAVYRLIRIG